MPTLSLLAAPQVVITTTYCATSDHGNDKVGIMKTHDFCSIWASNISLEGRNYAKSNVSQNLAVAYPISILLRKEVS